MAGGDFGKSEGRFAGDGNKSAQPGIERFSSGRLHSRALRRAVFLPFLHPALHQRPGGELQLPLHRQAGVSHPSQRRGGGEPDLRHGPRSDWRFGGFDQIGFGGQPPHRPPPRPSVVGRADLFGFVGQRPGVGGFGRDGPDRPFRVAGRGQPADFLARRTERQPGNTGLVRHRPNRCPPLRPLRRNHPDRPHPPGPVRERLHRGPSLRLGRAGGAGRFGFGGQPADRPRPRRLADPDQVGEAGPGRQPPHRRAFFSVPSPLGRHSGRHPPAGLGFFDRSGFVGQPVFRGHSGLGGRPGRPGTTEPFRQRFLLGLAPLGGVHRPGVREFVQQPVAGFGAVGVGGVDRPATVAAGRQPAVGPLPGLGGKIARPAASPPERQPADRPPPGQSGGSGSDSFGPVGEPAAGPRPGLLGGFDRLGHTKFGRQPADRPHPGRAGRFHRFDPFGFGRQPVRRFHPRRPDFANPVAGSGFGRQPADRSHPRPDRGSVPPGEAEFGRQRLDRRHPRLFLFADGADPFRRGRQPGSLADRRNPGRGSRRNNLAVRRGQAGLFGPERNGNDLRLPRRTGDAGRPHLPEPFRQPAHRPPPLRRGLPDQVADPVGRGQPVYRFRSRRLGFPVPGGGRLPVPARFLRQRDHRPPAPPAPFRGGTGRVPFRGPGDGGVRRGVGRSNRFPGFDGRRGRARRGGRHRRPPRIRRPGRQPVRAGHADFLNVAGGYGRAGSDRGFHFPGSERDRFPTPATDGSGAVEHRRRPAFAGGYGGGHHGHRLFRLRRRQQPPHPGQPAGGSGGGCRNPRRHGRRRRFLLPVDGNDRPGGGDSGRSEQRLRHLARIAFLRREVGGDGVFHHRREHRGL